jgi:hypothetical protein
MNTDEQVRRMLLETNQARPFPIETQRKQISLSVFISVRCHIVLAAERRQHVAPGFSPWVSVGNPQHMRPPFFMEWGEQIVVHHIEDCGSDTSVDKTGHKENEMGM